MYKSDKPAKQPWRWHFFNRGKITGQGESHDSESKAIARSTGLIKAIFKEWGIQLTKQSFVQKWDAKRKCTKITWKFPI